MKGQNILLMGSCFMATGCLLEHWLGTTFSSICIFIGLCGIGWGFRHLKQPSRPTEPISREKRGCHIGWVIVGAAVSCVIGFFMLRLQYPQFGVATCLLISSLTFLIILGIAYWRLRQIWENWLE